MKKNLLIYALPVLLFAMLLYGYGIQDHPTNTNQSSTKEFLQANQDNIPVTSRSSGLCTYTWAPQTSGTSNQLLSVSAVSHKVGWAAGAGPTVRRTTDGGTIWTSATGTGITGDIFNIYAIDDQTAFCTTTPGATNLYRTIDGGTTWTLEFTQAGGFIDAIQMTSPTEGYALGDPVGGLWTVLQTIDGGDTWARMATEPAQVGSQAGWNNSFLIVGTHMWFGTNGTRVYHSPDLGATWSFAATTGTLNTFAVHFNNISDGLAGGGAMVKSNDGGATYTAALSPGTVGNINGLEGNGTDWWALRNDANIYTSADQGTTPWTIAHSQTGAVFQDIDLVEEGGCAIGWAVGNGGNIAKMTPDQVYTIDITLSGLQEVPPNVSPGTGTLTGTYNDATNVIDFDLVFSGLVSPTVNAHFHAPAPRGMNASVIIGFIPNGFPLGVTSGAFSSSYTLTAGQEAQLLAGLVYVNVHTMAFPGGEIRAQLDSIGSNSTLPVELSSFASNVLQNAVTLNWSTATETNNAGFDIERSIVNGEWSKVGNVTGNGTTTSQMNYNFTDRNLNSGQYNYRLKQIDFNGNFEYFNLNNEVIVGSPINFELSQNYPNPFNPSTKIEYQLANDGNVNVSVYDNSGKEVMSLINEFKSAGYYTINFNGSSLSSGVYFYKISAGDFSSVKKMMLVK